MSKFVITVALTFIAIGAATARQNPDQRAQGSVRKPGTIPNKQHESSLSHCLPSGVRLDHIVGTKE
jgi:hypothetical protein